MGSPEISDEAALSKEVENENKTEEDNYSPANAFSSGVKSHCSTIPEFYDLDNSLSDGIVEEDPVSQDNMPASITGAGLDNLGNTCFLNSVLQCFMHTVPLLRSILLEPHSLHSYCDEQGFCTLCALRELVKSSLANRIVSPSYFTNNLSYFSSSFKKFQQEDAHEFLQCFLDKLESCHDSQRKEYTSSPSGNLVQQVFGGRLVSKLKCCNCAHCSDTYEPLIDTSLGIENADDLVTALQSFTKVEKIDDPEDKVTCENCKELVSVEKQLSFDKAPSVAVFHLKRFENDGCWVQKIDKHVAFPLELDLLPFIDSGKTNDADLKYVLYAVIVHIGSTPTSGHYYCFIRLSPNVWCKFDDSRVVLVHEDYVLSQEAYILFYAKEDTPWFSSFMETQLSCVHSTISKTSPRSVLDSVETPTVSPLLPNNKFSCDSNEVSHEITGSERKSIHTSVVKDIGRIQNKSERIATAENLHRKSATPVVHCPTPTTASSDVSFGQAQKKISPIVLKNVKKIQNVDVVAKYQKDIQRSPSPEIYREDPPYKGYNIPRLAERMGCKRRLEKDIMVDDLETKQAFTFIKKNMHSSRAQQMMAALRVSKTEEASVNRKKSRTSLNKDDVVEPTHRDSTNRLRQRRPLVTGNYR
ncbi:hypothetical protein ACP275_01G118000 [Erythranthe tilingii]